MKNKSITSIIILGIIGVIFSSDAILLSLGYETYSETITNWISQSGSNLILFIGGVVLLSVHWIFGYYNNKKSNN